MGNEIRLTLQSRGFKPTEKEYALILKQWERILSMKNNLIEAPIDEADISLSFIPKAGFTYEQ